MVNGAGADYSYDAASRLLYVDNQTANGQHKYAYTYDYVGNRKDMTVTDSSGVRKHVYSYDNIYQITAVDYPPELSYLATDTQFSYDAAGNRTSVIDGSGTCNYTTNNLNQYTAAGPTNLYYDASGNMTRDGNYSYGYDPENRLTQVKKLTLPAQQLNSFSAYTQGGDAPWVADSGGFAKSGDIDDSQESWMYIDVSGPGTVQFQWKVSSEEWDRLEFRVDDVYYSSLSGVQDWETESFTLTGLRTHRLQWRYYKDGSGSEGDDCGYVKAVTFTPVPDALAEAVDSGLAFTTYGTTGGWTVETGSQCLNDWDQATATTSDNGAEWLQTTVTGPGTIKFWWSVSSEGYCDYLEFYLDDVLQDSLTGLLDWREKSCTVTGAGTHTLQWCYVKDSSGTGGVDRAWVDRVQWNGSVAEPATTAWGQINYVYDAAGRRIEKKYEGRTVLKYIYDGDHCLAEYGAGNDLHRKYVYGPAVDEPIALIESTGSYAGTYYYHFDGLGSVTALTSGNVGSMGNTVEVYEYDVYGRVGASVPAHPNRLMFTGREYDQETGLYYYRARYYNPQIGRFLQTDPVGYEAGMNLHAYCGNDPLNYLDPQGLKVWREKNGGEWHREPKPGNVFPEIAPPMWAPFFTQHFPMSCVGVAILNAALNAGTEPLKMSKVGGQFSEQKTDLQAEGWVMAQVKAVNPSSDAFNYGSDIRAAPLILGSAWHLNQGAPTASRIRAAIDNNKTVIVGVDLNTTRKDMNGDRAYDGQDRQWHAVTIMKVPENAAPKIPGRDYKYYVVNAEPTDEYGQGNYFTAEEFDAWLSSYPAIHGEWVVGPGSN